jgi:hypothetical protein
MSCAPIVNTLIFFLSRNAFKQAHVRIFVVDISSIEAIQVVTPWFQLIDHIMNNLVHIGSSSFIQRYQRDSKR